MPWLALLYLRSRFLRPRLAIGTSVIAQVRAGSGRPVIAQFLMRRRARPQ
ncbi:hypothetical protein BTB1458_3572 [Mycobacterium tuberculosis]|nr:hypothetical protein BTB1458_3572 [Mycobacterium tuberculosis]BAW14345.1 hypothetical protein NCGM946K2_3583 [Mycobacterium tuberculosis]